MSISKTCHILMHSPLGCFLKINLKTRPAEYNFVLGKYALSRIHFWYISKANILSKHYIIISRLQISEKMTAYYQFSRAKFKIVILV